MKSGLAVFALYFALLLAGASAAVTWDGGADDSNWFNPTNWIGDVAPGATDDVFIVTNGTAGPTLTGSVAVFTLTVSNKTLTFQGTNTVLTASNVVVAGSNGKITHLAQTTTATNGAGLWLPSNLVWIVCTNFTLDSSASVNVDGKGYGGGPIGTTGYGPGRGPSSGTYGSGGSHGGVGGNSGGGTAATNGSEVYPFDPGSGGGGGNTTAGGAGGGAVCIEAAGRALIDGVISANGVNGTVNAGGGSGGGIYLGCHTLAGAGAIRANAGRGVKTIYVGGSGGGGGRIAVRFAAAESPAIEFGASGGPPGYRAGRPGTLWLSQYNGILSETWTNGLELATNAWSPGSFTISNSTAFAAFRSNFTLTTTGGVRILSGAQMELVNGSTLACSSLAMAGSAVCSIGTNCLVNVGHGDVTLTNACRLYVYMAGGFTNVANMSIWGSTNYLYCHSTSGVPPRAFTVSNFTLGTGSLLSAEGLGYAGGPAGTAGYGLGPGGGGTYAGGGGHGGRGGARRGGGGGGVTNGSELFPFDPGSGGGGGNSVPGGGAGGGAVRIEATNGTVMVEGIMTANGANAPAVNGGGGAGGGICISCWTLAGRGTIQANGGSTISTPQGGGGGGGRIAVYYVFDNFYGAFSVSNGTGYYSTGTNTAGTGTVFRAVQAGFLELFIDGSPQQHGTSSPYAYGSSGVASNSVVTNSVNTPADEDNGVRYACIGWSGTGSVPAGGSSNQVSFLMTNASRLTWLWTNEFYLAATSGPNGRLAADPSDWYTNGMQVTVSAVASDGYHFVQWSGDVGYGEHTNHPLVLTLDRAKAVQANFGIDGG